MRTVKILNFCKSNQTIKVKKDGKCVGVMYIDGDGNAVFTLDDEISKQSIRDRKFSIEITGE